MATAEMVELMTAEQFGQRPDPGYPVFSADDPPKTLAAEQEPTLPEVLEEFRIRVDRFFE